MPLDPSIILANADPARQYDPVASMQKAQSLKTAMLQGQVQEQALQDAKDFTRINGVTPGMAKHQQELATAQWRTQEAKSAATNENIKAQDWLAAQQSRTYQTALDALESGAAPPEQIHNWTLGTTAKNAQQLGIDTSKSDDPKRFDVQIPNHPTESDPSVPQMAPEWDREAQKRWLQQQVKATTPEAVAQKRAELAATQQKAEWEQTRPRSGAGNTLADYNADRSQRGLPPVGMEDPGFQKVLHPPKAVAPGFPSGPAGASPQEVLAGLSANDQAIVNQLASRQLMVGRQGGFQLNNPRNQGLYAVAVRLNPSLSVVDNAAYQDFIKDLAKSSPQSAGGRTDSGNRLLGHSGELVDALVELNPGSGVTGRIGNVLSYPTQRAFGDAMGKVSFIKSKVLAEVNKLVTGGVPHAKELEDDIKNMPDTATKEQWAQIIKAIADVGLEQVTATEEKRNNFLGALAPKTSLLSAKAQSNLSKIYKYAGAAPPQLAAPSGAGYTTTAQAGNPQATKPQAGIVVDGYVFNGGDPADPKNWKKQ